MRITRVTNLYLTLLVVSLALNTHALAKEPEDSLDETGPVDLSDSDVETTAQGWPRFSLSAGVAYLDADGVLGARPPNSPPITIINFDRVGLDESDASHWFSLTWRARESRWGAWFANWRYDVNGDRIWESEWPIAPGQTIPVGARVNSEFDADWYIAEVTYSFIQNESMDAGIGFGLHTVDLDTELTAQVDIGDGRIEVVQGDLSTLAPLPNVLGYLYWDFLPRWNLVARLGWFGMEYDRYSGQMVNAHLMASYEFNPRFSLGAAYQFVRLDVDIERKYYREIYDIDFEGPMVYARLRF